MAIIRLISMNDKKYDLAEEEYQQLQSSSNSEQSSNVNWLIKPESYKAD